MIKRPTKKILTSEQQRVLSEASAQQTGKSTKIRSYDPNFPVFDVPVNQKVLIYIPNHTTVLPDGSVEMIKDVFGAHPIIDGRTFEDVRCLSGWVDESLGLDGSCPLCDAMADNWALYNKELEEIAAAKGIDPKGPDADSLLKEDRRAITSKMVVKNAERWYVFPIVVIACQEKDGKMTLIPKKDAENRISGKPMWYTIRERTYESKWGAAFDSLDEDDGNNCPAGRWAVLNFTYPSKDGSWDKMNSARNLQVTFKSMPGYEQWESYFDTLTEEWTVEKIRETVVIAALRDMEEMREVEQTVMKPVRDKLALYALSAGLPGATTGAAPALPNTGAKGADATLSQFGADKAEPMGGVPDAGEMPDASEMPA